MNTTTETYDNADYYRSAYYQEREKLASLVKAADELHRVTFRDFSHRSEWQRLGRVMDEVAPRDFDRVSGEPRDGI